MNRVVAAAVTLAIGWGSARADRVDERADCEALVEQARAHHEAERYGEALAASRTAYACDPNPGLLFAMGQIAFNLEDYAAAEAWYQKFLASEPDPEGAALALQALAVTRERIEAKQRPPMIVLAPRRTDRLAWTLAIGSGVTSLVGGGLYLTARLRAGDTSGRHGDYVQRVEDARTLRNIAIACGGVGAALALGATIRWLVSSDPELPVPTRTSIVPLAGDVVGVAITGAL